MTNDALGGVLGSMAQEGWGAFQGLDDRLQKDLLLFSEQQTREANIVADALNTDAGRVFLDWLIRRTICRPPSPEEDMAKTLEECALRAERRRGQNAVTYTILHALAVAAGDKLAKGVPE